MNRIFRIIWSKALCTWVIASEFATRNGKGGGGADVDERSEVASPPHRRVLGGWQMRACAAGVVLALHAPAWAADRYWDTNGNGTGLGGTGVWDGSNLFWNSSSTGTAGTVFAWDNAALDNAIFGGTGGTVTLGAPITAHNLQFLTGYTLTGSTLTLAGTTPTIYMATGTTISSTLAGSNGVTFNGQGTTDNYLFLGGTNTITGGITLTNGAYLVATGSNALNGANNVVTINNGTILRLDNNNAFGGDTAASRLVLNGGQFRLLRGITSAHNLTLTGGANTSIYEELNGLATWSGTAVLTANTTLRLGAENTLAVTGNLGDSGANVLSLTDFSGNVRYSGNLSFSGNFTLQAGVTWFDGGTHTYTGDTILTGGQLVLNSASTRSPFTNFRFEGATGNANVIYGTTAVPSITLPLGTGDGQVSWNGTGGFYALGAGLAGGGSDVTVNLGGASAPLTWNVGGFVPTDQWLVLGSNEGGGNARQLDFQNPIDFNGALRTVRVDNGSIADHVLLSGQLTGTGGLQIVGDGALELTNTGNNYSGATVVGNATNGNWGNLILNAAGTLSPNSNLQINGVGTGDLEQHGGYVLLTAASGPFTRAVGTGAGQVQWTASGGFGAIGAPRMVNLFGDGRTLTWGAGGFVSTGQALRFGGNWANSTVNWQNGIDLGAVDRVINVNEGQGRGFSSATELEVNLNGVIQGTGGLILRGQGDVALSALNTYSGTTWIGENNPAEGAEMWAWANTLADTGVASSLGTGSTIVLNSHVGGLIYTGGATSSNRTLALNRSNTGIHHFLNYGTGAINWTGSVTMTGSGLNELRLGGTYATTTDANGIAIAPNIVSGVISDGTGTTRVRGWNSGSCTTGGVWRLTGTNTFTSELFPDGCTFEVTTIGNAGAASSIGAGDLIADMRGLGGTLRYIGSGDTTDRLFWSWGNAHLESSGTGPLVLTNTGVIVDRNGGFLQWLGGSNTGDNLFAPTLVNGLNAAEFHSSGNIFTLGKDGGGLWALTTDNNNHANAYAGNTRVLAGALRLDDAGAITGGLGASSSHGAIGSSERSSLVVFEGTADGTGGVIGLTAASGGFFRGTTTTARAFQDNNGTTVGVDPDGPTEPLPAYGLEALDDDNYVQGVRWLGSGGFAAWDGTQTVNLFGDAREVTWGTGGFVLANHQLVFGYQTADGTVDFRNGINLGSTARTVHVNDGLAQRDAVMSGVLRGTSVLGGLTKTGTGSLTLTANNTYTGITTVSAGTLELGNGSTTGSMGTGAQALIALNATLVANHSNAFNLTQSIIGDGTLIQRGTGTTTMTSNSDIDHVVMEQGRLVTPGTLLTNDITFTNLGGATLQVAGALRTSTGGAAAVAGGTGNDTIRIDATGNLLANGTLGAGADTLDVSGTLDTGAGSFDLADGDDTLVVRDGANLIGPVLGGVGIDTFNANVGTTADLDVVQGFETLTKTGVGVLHLNGPGASDFSTVNVNAGTLDVDAGAAIVATAGGTLNATIASGATLNVDGAFGCGSGNDSITIAGNVTGGGTIDQCGGDDTLTLRDGANISGYANVFNGGANTAGIGDTVQLDIAGALVFGQGAVTNYENLLKSNTGVATLGGSHTYTGSTTISGGTLDVDGSLTTPAIAMTNAAGTTTLNVDGTVQASGGTQTVITGGAGSNTVNVNAGAMLLASGALGDGTDTLDVAGTLNTGAGSFDLGNGNDALVIHDNTNILGTVIGGAGIDTLNANIAGTANLGVVQSFETLTKTGVGTLHVNGPGTSDFATVNVNAGTLDVAAGSAIAAAPGGTLATAIANGATLNVNGAYGCGTGTDTLAIAGNLTGGGTIDQCGGDDTLTLSDGANLAQTNAISGGAHTVGDTVALNNALAMTLDGGDIANYELLVKNQAGIATLAGAHGFSGGATLNAGTLDVDGSLTTPTIAMTNATGTTTLNVDGTVQASGGTQVLLTGGAGVNAVTVGVTGTLLASGNLGGGSDVLDVSGTLDTGAGTFDLGDGDDTFLIHDGTVVLGAVAGGAGVDTRIFDLAGSASVGALQGFEGLTKRGAGILNITGPGVSELADVRIEGGTVDVQLGSTVVAQAGSPLNTTVLAGATLNVDGSYTASTGSDTMDVSGTVSGSGTIDLADGNDTLILNDGASLTGTNPIDGGAHGAGDTVALNFSGNYVFTDTQTVNFEILRKQNTGTATLTGTQAWQSVQLDGGTLTAAGLLETLTVAMADGTTLNVDGTLQGNAGGYAAITGSAGANTVNVASGALLQGNGDLGDGNDVLDVAGTLDTNGGAFSLGGGDDMFVVHDTTTMLGTVDGGLGNDLLNVNVGTGNLVPLGSLLGFESLGKSGAGTLQINGPSSFIDVGVAAGTLQVSATGSVAAQNTTVGLGATLQVDGSYTGTSGSDTMVVAGTVAGNGTVNLADGADSFTLQDGANLSGLTTAIDGGAGIDAFVADLAGTATLGGMVNFETLTKTNTGTLNIDGPAPSSFSTVNVDGGTLDIGAGGSVTAIAGGVLNTTVAAGATLNVDGSYGCGAGNDTLNVAGTVSGSGTIDLCGGEDTLTLNDGATLTAVVSGGTHGAGDTVVLNNAGALNFDAGNTINFEFLQKDNVGEATLTGAASFSGGTAVNGGTLTVAGTLATPTVVLADDTVLNVNGSLQGNAGGYSAITGSAGANTVNVAAGALLQAGGDLGDGNDVFDVAGTLDTGGAVFGLGAGDDTLVVHDSTAVFGTVDGGLGNDLLNVNVSTGNLVPLGSMLGFESLGKSGDGTLQINGPSSFIGVDVMAGTLQVGATGSVAAQNTTVASGSTLQVDGSYTGTSGNDTMAVAGTIAGNGTVDLAGGDDSFTLQDGADLSGLTTSIDGGAGTDTFIADLVGSATLGGAVNFETLTKTNTGTLNVNGPAPSAFTTVNVVGGTLDVGAAGTIGGFVTTTVADGATLNVDGSYQGSAGNDGMDVSGAITGIGLIAFDGGDDTLTLYDGADLSGFIGLLDGGAHSGGDTIVLDNASALTFGAGAVVNFEVLSKQNTGTATLVGNHGYGVRTEILGGGLVVAGSLATPQVVMGDDTSLTVDGSLEAGGGAAAAILGSAGTNTVTISGTAIATGDLGAGNDTLDVVGTLDTGGSAFGLGDGDDNFVVHDGTVVLGTIDGGAGLDTRVYDINGAADLGALINFEGVTKTGTGTLNINGPGTTALQAVDVLGGTLNIGPGGSVAAAAGGTLTTVVGTGATLNVDGSFGCGDGSDGLSVSGTVSGSGTIDLCGGDDTLTLNDGAVLTATISGGGQGSGDTVVLNNAGALSFDGSNVVDFEKLQKDNIGEATLTGTQSFAGGTTVNGGTLTVAGSLDTPALALADDTTLNVDGTVQGNGSGYAAITGSAGINTVNVAGGALLQASGDLGDGDDVLDVAGTLDTGGGPFSLGSGDDTFVVHDTTTMLGTVDGGLGNDMLNVNVGIGNMVPLGSLLGFESLGKSGDGTLQINGPSSFIDVDIMAGTLEVGAGGTVSAQATTVAAGASLQVDGAYAGTAGDDTMIVAGAIAGSGTVDLAAGNDSFTLQDGADLSGLATPIDGGAGTDTFVADLTGTATLGGAINFETLSKTGAGTLNINGPMSSDFSTVDILAGTVNVAANGSVMAQNTTVAASSTLQIAGSYSGTAGNDSFTSMGTVRGALAFGAGADTARFVGGDVSGLTGLDGGAGSSDLLTFSGLDLVDSNVSAITGWERMELSNDSALTLGTAFNLGGGVLAIDATSRLLANAGASIGGSVENAGLIDVGSHRPAIGGGYTSNAGALQLTVSPGTASSGGLNIAGDVVGTTRVVFDSDGSSPAAGTTAIQVIASPNDNTGTAGGFVPDGSTDGLVRLDGSPFPWTFGQQADHNWYLSAEAATVLPEINGYSVLDGLGTLSTHQALDMGHDRLGGIRGAERPKCDSGRAEYAAERAGTGLADDCHGVWVAATASELELGADPGVEVTGDDVGLYVGIDGALDRDNKTLRGGAYLGYLHGVYWTTGANSGNLAMDPARVDMDAPVVGLYGSSQWNNGTFIDMVLSGQRLRANVSTTDGFTDRLSGDTLALSARFGRSYRLDNGWSLEPQVQLSVSQVKWDDHVDAGGRELLFDDDLVGKARAALRVEKAFTTSGGAQVRPWATLGVQNVIGESDNGVRLAQPGSASGAISLPNHDLGTSASLDIGLDVTVDKHVSFFGAISVDQDLSGSDFEQRGANVGMRVRW